MLANKRVSELRALCASLRIPVRKQRKMMNKAALIAALDAHFNMARAAKVNLQALLERRKTNISAPSTDGQCDLRKSKTSR